MPAKEASSSSNTKKMYMAIKINARNKKKKQQYTNKTDSELP